MPFRQPWAAYASVAYAALVLSGIATPAHAQRHDSAQPSTQSDAQTSAAARFQRVQRQYRAAKTFRITFEQTLSNPLTGSTSSARGELVSERPNRFAITFTEPSTGDRIVSDGTSIWLYLPSSAPGQVIKLPAGSGQSAMSDPIGHILTASSSQYHLADAGRATVSGHAVHGVTLTPTGSDPWFTKATVWIDDADDAVRRIDTNEASGVTRQVVLVAQTTNVSVPRATFTFTVPPKVRVVDQRTLGN